MGKIALILALCLPTLALAADKLEKEKALELINSTVQIENSGNQGTGVILHSQVSEDDPRIKKTYILTNEHVVSREGSLCKISIFVFLKQRSTVGRKEYEAEVVFVSDNHDIALVEIETPVTEDFKSVEIASEKSWDQMTLCDPVYLVSCGAGTVPCLTEGLLASVDKEETELGMTANIIYGSSGGGIYNGKGQLIGLASAMKVTKGHPISHKALGIPLTTILREIRDSDYDFILEEDENVFDEIPDDWSWEEDSSNKKKKVWH
jgi:S1-C subfamily serine protease